MELSVYDKGILGGSVAFAAYQDGDGAWQTLARGPQGYRFSLTNAAQRYSVAYVCSNATPQLHISQMTVAEVPEPAATCGNPAAPTEHRVSVQVTVKNAVGSVQASGVTAISANSSPSDTHSFSFLGSQGQGSVMAVPGLYNVTASESGSNGVPGRALILRNVSVDASTPLEIDMDKGFALEQHALTIGNFGAGPVGGVNLSARAELLTNLAGSLSLMRRDGAPESDPVTRPFYMVPANQLQDNDFHMLSVGSSSDSTIKSYMSYFKSPQDLNIRLPDTQVVQFQVRRAPAANQYWWQWNAAAPTAVTLHVSTRDSAGNLAAQGASIVLSHGWLGDAQLYESPDLSGLPAWNSAWNVPASQPVYWDGHAVTDSKPTDYIWLYASVQKTPTDWNKYLSPAYWNDLTITSTGRSGTVQP